MSEPNFDKLSRQSPKGIVVNYGILLYKLLKSFWVHIPLVLTKNTEGKLGYLIIFLGVLGLILLLIATVQYLYFKFKIEGEYFIVHQGMIFKKKTSIHIERIQSVNFKQNIIHQLINITQVEIQTAGAKDVEVSIKAISRENAEVLKNRLQNITNKLFFDGLDAKVEEKVEEKLIYQLSTIDLLKVSFSENHIRSFFFILALVFSFGYQLEDIVKEWNFADEIIQFVIKNKTVISGSIAVLGLFFIVGLIISVVVSFVRVFLVHFDQNVIQKNDGIQLREGLFTKREDVLKIKKIQYSITVTNPIKQKMGIQTVRIR
jgi:putative membrane protein